MTWGWWHTTMLLDPAPQQLATLHGNTHTAPLSRNPYTFQAGPSSKDHETSQTSTDVQWLLDMTKTSCVIWFACMHLQKVRLAATNNCQHSLCNKWRLPTLSSTCATVSNVVHMQLPLMSYLGISPQCCSIQGLAQVQLVRAIGTSQVELLPIKTTQPVVDGVAAGIRRDTEEPGLTLTQRPI